MIGRASRQIRPPMAWWVFAVMALVVAAGLVRLRFEADIFSLLPASLPAVRGLQMQQQHFANSRELLVTFSGSDPEAVGRVAERVGSRLQSATNRIRAARWQAPWMEHPLDAAQNLGWIWLQQEPAEFQKLASRISGDRIKGELEASKELLATSLDPRELAIRSYDPLGFTRIPGLGAIPPGFDSGTGIFSNADGTFRVVIVEPENPRMNYRTAADWVGFVRREASSVLSNESPGETRVEMGITGGPAFLSEISTGMESDLRSSIATTVAVITVLFWIAHRSWRPLGWLIASLLLTLLLTLALGGLVFGTLNVVSLGFAAVLLGLAVDYGLVSYQEFVSSPGSSVEEIRHEAAPGIYYSAVTTACTFSLLGFAGLPGLAQMGCLTAMGLLVGSVVMLYVYLPIVARAPPRIASDSVSFPLGWMQRPWWPTLVFGAIILATLGWHGLPKVNGSADPLRPKDSAAYDAMDTLKAQFGRTNEPLWVLFNGGSESEVASQLAVAEQRLIEAEDRGEIDSHTLPTGFWPRPENARRNLPLALALFGRTEEIQSAAAIAGFTPKALSLAVAVLDSWKAMGSSPDLAVSWPTNETARWMVSQFAARTGEGRWLALGIIQPSRTLRMDALAQALPIGVIVTSWDSLGASLLAYVSRRVERLTGLIALMLVVSLWMAFKGAREVFLSLCALAMALGFLLSIMVLLGWKWNLLSLVALPLLLGASVDSTIHVQLALRRHGTDFRKLWGSTGKALLLCAGANIAGFSSLAFTNNAGLASLDLVCAIGVACVLVVCLGLLPVWWYRTARSSPAPSLLYSAAIWNAGLWMGQRLPGSIAALAARFAAFLYRLINRRRMEVVVENLTPILPGGKAEAERAARENFGNFARKVVDLWRWEAGVDFAEAVDYGSGQEYFSTAAKSGRGVLFVTPHLGNWEFGGSLITRNGGTLTVLTAQEPARLTKLRSAARSRMGIETLVVGDNLFAFLEVIRRLRSGNWVATLIDRPTPASAVDVKFCGRKMKASLAVAELARSSGCVVLPVYIVREGGAYRAHSLPPVEYNPAELTGRTARIEFTERVMNCFEPAIRKYATQWYHFVPMWKNDNHAIHR